MIHAGDLIIDRERFLVTVHGRPGRLTFLEFNALWAIAEQDARRRLAAIVSRIRAKLGDQADVIDTVTRVGYRLAPSLAA